MDSSSPPAPGPAPAALPCACPACVQAANQALMHGTKWASQNPADSKTVITYSFAAPGTSSFADSYGPLGFQSSAREFSNADKDSMREVLAKISAVCNVAFVEVADNAGGSGVIRYAYSDLPNAMGYSGYSFFPSNSALGGDVWIGASQASAEWDSYRPYLFLHETLHALGLKHPFDDGARLPAEDNLIFNTVMSYSPMPGAATGTLSSYPAEPMKLDIAALQDLYGAASHGEGDTTYNLADAQFQGAVRTLWDSSGTDALDAGAVAHAVMLDLDQGASSDVGMSVFAFAFNGGRVSDSAVRNTTLAIALGTVIENATGSAYNDTLRGNDADNLIKGGDGDDRIEGGAGNDTIGGGAGLDTAVYAGSRDSFRISRAGDHFIVGDITGRAGTDTLTGVERLVFADATIALDLDGHAGLAALLLGAVAGPAAVHNPVSVGRMLALLDGGASALDAAAALCDALVGQPLTSEDFVQIVLRNLTGQAAGQPELGYYTQLLDSGACSQASLALAAAGTELNMRNIDITGLASAGLDYTLLAH